MSRVVGILRSTNCILKAKCVCVRLICPRIIGILRSTNCILKAKTGITTHQYWTKFYNIFEFLLLGLFSSFLVEQRESMYVLNYTPLNFYLDS